MAYLMLILASMFWGGNYVVSKLLVVNLSPGLLAESRWLVASLLLIMIYHKPFFREMNEIKKSIANLFFLALFGPVLFPTALYIGLQYTSALNAAILLSSSPALVLFINAVIFKDKIAQHNIMGVLLSSLGVMYLILKGHISTIHHLQVGKGDFWAFMSALSWAIYCACLRTKNKKLSGGAFLTASSLLGTLILIPFAFIEFVTLKQPIAHLIDNNLILGILFLAIFPSLLSYLLWNKGISLVGSTRGEIYTHFVPFFGALFSIIFLGDAIYTYHAVGAILIILGIMLCSKKQRLNKHKISSLSLNTLR